MLRMACGMCLVVTLLAANGCATFNLTKSDSAPPVAKVAEAYPPVPMIAVECHSASGKVKVEELPLEEGMTVSEALEKTKANKRFRRAFVDVQRTHNGNTHKMPIDFNNGNNRVSHSTDYALHPRDRVMVREDSSTIVDDLMQKVLGTSPKRPRRT